MKFNTLTARALPLRKNNIDTDQIIPARYLLMTSNTGFGQYLFYDWRFTEDGRQKDFVFNDQIYRGAEILIAGENFGSGSSREHAVWAIQQAGIKVVIAPSFSDIFRNNAYSNGLLVFTLPVKTIEEMFIRVEKNPQQQLCINLAAQTIEICDNKKKLSFEINQFVKTKLLNGLDNIGYVLGKEELIKNYEKKMNGHPV